MSSSGVLRIDQKTFPLISLDVFKATRLDANRQPTDHVRTTLNICVQSFKGDEEFWKTIKENPGVHFDGEISHMPSENSGTVDNYQFKNARLNFKKNYYLERDSFPMTLEILISTDDLMMDSRTDMNDMLDDLMK